METEFIETNPYPSSVEKISVRSKTMLATQTGVFFPFSHNA